VKTTGFLFAGMENKRYFAESKHLRIMKRNRMLATMALVSAVVILVALTAGCKKQPKCGCDGDALDTLEQAHVNITYDAVNKTARFSTVWDSYSIYYFCNPSQWISELTKFSQNEEILVSGPYFYECNYLMNSSNSYYYSYMRIYQVQVTAVASYDYGK